MESTIKTRTRWRQVHERGTPWRALPLTGVRQRAAQADACARDSMTPGFVVKAELQKFVDPALPGSPAHLSARPPASSGACRTRSGARLRWWELALFWLARRPSVRYRQSPAVPQVVVRTHVCWGLSARLGCWRSGSAAGSSRAGVGESLHPRQSHRAGSWTTFRYLRGSWPIRRDGASPLLIAFVVLIPTALYACHLETEHDRWDLSVQDKSARGALRDAGRQPAEIDRNRLAERFFDLAPSGPRRGTVAAARATAGAARVGAGTAHARARAATTRDAACAAAGPRRRFLVESAVTRTGASRRLPTVAAWERELAGLMDGDAHASLIERAERTCSPL